MVLLVGTMNVIASFENIASITLTCEYNTFISNIEICRCHEPISSHCKSQNFTFSRSTINDALSETPIGCTVDTLEVIGTDMRVLITYSAIYPLVTQVVHYHPDRTLGEGGVESNFRIAVTSLIILSII